MKINILGKIDYDSAIKLQLKERELVKAGKSAGTIFFLEHKPSVITIGRNAACSNLLVSEKFLKSKGYEVRKVSRGGDITVHEPGQLVIYFVMPLKSKAVRSFVDSVTNCVKNCLRKDYGINADFDPKRPGLWVNDRKICSIGFDLTYGVSMHGIALNVSNTLEGFSLIVPCGITDVRMTSMSNILGRMVEIDLVRTDLIGYYSSQNMLIERGGI